MRRVAVDDVDADTHDSGTERCGLSDRLGTTSLALNHYR